MNYKLKVFLFGLIVLSVSLSINAQMKRRVSGGSIDGENIASASQPASPAPTPTPAKKNGRPNAGGDVQKVDEPQKSDPKNSGIAGNAPYKYEFSQPNFVVRKIVIEHDENGKGTITFEKKNADEPITDPVQVSASSLERINTLLQTLNFIDSSENYQSPMRDYGHLGDNELTLRKDGKTRTAKYNWSENLDARTLAGEYRKIGEQYIWIFDMGIARDNQPLEAPGLMDKLDSLLRRNEISDPSQLLPALKDFSTDERLPLMARNHAVRIIKEIEKKK